MQIAVHVTNTKLQIQKNIYAKIKSKTFNVIFNLPYFREY